MNYLQTGKRNRNIRTAWRRMRHIGGGGTTHVDTERKSFQNEEVQYGEAGSELQRTLKDGSIGIEPRKDTSPDKTNLGNYIFN
jgi:hypothetical protein